LLAGAIDELKPMLALAFGIFVDRALGGGGDGYPVSAFVGAKAFFVNAPALALQIDSPFSQCIGFFLR